MALQLTVVTYGDMTSTPLEYVNSFAYSIQEAQCNIESDCRQYCIDSTNFLSVEDIIESNDKCDEFINELEAIEAVR